MGKYMVWRGLAGECRLSWSVLCRARISARKGRGGKRQEQRRERCSESETFPQMGACICVYFFYDSHQMIQIYMDFLKVHTWGPNNAM